MFVILNHAPIYFSIVDAATLIYSRHIFLIAIRMIKSVDNVLRTNCEYSVVFHIIGNFCLNLFYYLVWTINGMIYFVKWNWILQSVCQNATHHSCFINIRYLIKRILLNWTSVVSSKIFYCSMVYVTVKLSL